LVREPSAIGRWRFFTGDSTAPAKGLTRVDDWPIMPADTTSFWLKPFGFFDENPSIDVAPSDTAEGDHCHRGLDDEHGYAHHH